MSASLFDEAPACAAVREQPVRTLVDAQRKMEEWSEAVRLIDALIQRDDVCQADKMSLWLERATANACLLACANIVTACEERMREQGKRLTEKWGWLL